jgi:integrase
MRTARLSKHKGIWVLRRRIPDRYRPVATQKSGFIKLTTGTGDRREAERRLLDVLKQWAELQASWEAKLLVVALTPARAREIAALWAAWIASGAELETGGIAASAFDMLVVVTDPRSVPAVWARIEAHTDEALALAKIVATADTRPLLLHVMEGVVRAAYADAELKRTGDWQSALGPNHVPPLDDARARLPTVPVTPSLNSPMRTPAIPLSGLFDAWKAVASVKPRTATETEYAIKLLRAFVGHDDAARITRDDMLRWRDAMNKAGSTNSTWNNRLSMMRQVFVRAVADGKLKANPTDGLRLPKGRANSWLPYSDEDAYRILRAARKETTPALRWGHWLMAFSGLRVAEALQLTGSDIRREGDIHYLVVNEDDASKSVKNAQRRSVPLHPALVAEGFLDYAATISPDGAVFPEKQLDKFGQRGGRGWNLLGVWARQTAGITDPRKAPNHSWRHRFEDELRAVEVPEDVRDALMGHARKTVGRVYGVRGEALTRLARAIALVPVPPGVTLPAKASAA